MRPPFLPIPTYVERRTSKLPTSAFRLPLSISSLCTSLTHNVSEGAQTRCLLSSDGIRFAFSQSFRLTPRGSSGSQYIVLACVEIVISFPIPSKTPPPVNPFLGAPCSFPFWKLSVSCRARAAAALSLHARFSSLIGRHCKRKGRLPPDRGGVLFSFPCFPLIFF